MCQDNLKQLMKHQKTRLHRGEIDASNIPISFQHVTNYLFTCHTIRNHLIYDETNSSQIAEKTSPNIIYDGFVTILDNVME